MGFHVSVSTTYFSIVHGVAQTFVIKAKGVDFSAKTFLVRIYQDRDGTPLPEMKTFTTTVAAEFVSPDTTIKVPLTEEDASAWEIGRSLLVAITVFNSDNTIAARGVASAKVTL
jgi:hypothetical protein